MEGATRVDGAAGVPDGNAARKGDGSEKSRWASLWVDGDEAQGEALIRGGPGLRWGRSRKGGAERDGGCRHGRRERK